MGMRQEHGEDEDNEDGLWMNEYDDFEYEDDGYEDDEYDNNDENNDDGYDEMCAMRGVS